MIDIYKRLELHLEESRIHTNRLVNVLETLKEIHPLTSDNLDILSDTNKDKLDVFKRVTN